jgi:biopolymer transport protein ExbB
MNQNLWETIRHGGVSMYIIFGCSIAAVAVALERMAGLWKFMDRSRALADTVKRCLQRGAVAEGRAACERSKSPLADVFLVGFERLGRSSREALQNGVDRERQKVILQLKSRLWVLGTVGAVAPFVGLFGTVVGIMSAFADISAKGQAGFAVVSKGISEALVATAAGILIGVLAVVIYNFFNQHLARMATEIKLLVEEFLEALQEKGPGESAAKEEKAA